MGVVPVPDARLDRLAELAGSKQVLPAVIEFVDIAGLVAGASKGEGLGNQFLANIRETDAIAHVVRCFDDPNVVHVEGSVDPIRDIETIETELLLKDLDTVARRRERVAKSVKTGDKAARAEADFLERLESHLGDGQPARTLEVSDPEAPLLREQFLLTAKPVLYAANVGEGDLPDGNAWVETVRQRADAEGAGVVVVSAEFEAQLAELDDAERAEFLEAAGVTESGLDRLAQEAYALLGLITYFTAGPEGVARVADHARHEGAPSGRASSTPTSRRGSSAPRPSSSPTTTGSGARSPRARPARCGARARSTSSPTAT